MLCASRLHLRLQSGDPALCVVCRMDVQNTPTTALYEAPAFHHHELLARIDARKKADLANFSSVSV